MPGTQWLYHAVSKNGRCGVAASASGRGRPHRSLDKTYVASYYGVPDAGRYLLCLLHKV